jgi:glycosyltransferase involved in cell wall biosynthesis
MGEAVAKQLQDRDIPYKIKILHLTPDCYPKYMEEGKYHIGRLFWETDKLPKEWIKPCNMMNEIWTASEKQADMIKNSGVTVPIYWFPQAADVNISKENIQPFTINQPRDYTFYSVFQWILRKNPKTLFRAYWKAFEGRSDVTLMVKTYGVNYEDGEKQKIIRDINEWKKEVPMKDYPKIYLVNKLLTETEIHKFHMLGDCYVSPSGGEGWGKPMHEAMIFGKPAISGAVGGITDYLNDTNYWKVKSTTVPASVTSWIPYYTADQNWQELDEDDLADKMRYVFDHKDEALIKAKIAQSFVIENWSYQNVGKLMLERLEKI